MAPYFPHKELNRGRMRQRNAWRMPQCLGRFPQVGFKIRQAAFGPCPVKDVLQESQPSRFAAKREYDLFHLSVELVHVLSMEQVVHYSSSFCLVMNEL